MTLEKAIKLNQESEKSLRDHKFIDHADAVKLSNEALKRVQQMRQDNAFLSPPPLPGEE